MTPDGFALFVDMARYAPVRTAIFSVGPPLWGLAQVTNAYLNGGALLFVCGFAVLLIALSVLITRYHAATFRRMRLARQVER